MRNAKKLCLLLLSLVLLCGIFAVAALAEEPAAVATVVYPDGSVDKVAVGSAIVPKEFVTETAKSAGAKEETFKLFYGEGNTLFKATGEDWIFTVEGADAALADLTVTDAMAGKKIIASGADKVYSTVKVTFPEGDYYKWIAGSTGFKIDGVQYYNTVWALAGTSGTKTQYVNNSGTLGTKDVSYDLTKRVAGTYNLFFYDEASLQSYFSTAASIEIGGVVCNYQDLRQGSSTTHEVKLYADHTVGNMFTWAQNGYDRPSTSDRTNTGSAGDGGTAKVYFDLNGHTVTNTSTSRIDARAIQVYLYSSEPGAHFFKEASSTAFYVNDDAAMYLGSKTSAGEYKDNLYVHAKIVLDFLNSGSGARIYGGHYYQTEATSSYLVNISGRLNDVQHASFYVKDGITVFGDTTAHNNAKTAIGEITITDCHFYTDGTSPIVKGGYKDKNGVVQTTTLKFKNCTFNGVSTALSEEEKAYITLGMTAGGNTTDGAAIRYSTATFYDGSTAYYYAADEAAAKKFVEGHPTAKTKLGVHEIREGDELFCIFDPVLAVSYDASFNATTAITGEAEKVYMTVETASGIEYVADASAYPARLSAILQKSTVRQTLTLYADVSTAATYVWSKESAGHAIKIDLNGYDWTITGKTGGLSLDVCAELWIYSTRPGAEIFATDSDAFFRTNDKTLDLDGDGTGETKGVGYVYFGEPNSTSTANGDNLTVHCKRLNADMYSVAAYIYGGIYRQHESSTYTYFVMMSREADPDGHFVEIRNATFIITKANSSVLHWILNKSRTFTNCSFVYEGEGTVPLLKTNLTGINNGETIANPIFDNCSFYNVMPTARFNYTRKDASVKTVAPTYKSNCAFGFSGEIPSRDLDDAEDTVMHFANVATPVEKQIAGKTYVMSAVLFTDPSAYLAIDWGVAVDFWEIGSTPYREAGDGEMLEDGILYFNPIFDMQAIEQIGEDGKVIAAGSATVSVVFSSQAAVALVYEDLTAGVTHYVFLEDCPDAAALGAKFYELFAAPKSAYYVTLYSDLLLADPCGFGALSTGSQPQHASFAYGAFTLDLNGYTFSVSENIGGIDLSNGNTYPAYADAILAIENTYRNQFTIKSSVPGAKIINPTTKIFIGIGERDSANLLVEGENIEVTTKGPFVGAIENEASNRIVVNGGKYTYTGSYCVFFAASNVQVTDATFILENENTACMFATPNYTLDNTTAQFKNVKVYAAGRAQLYGFTHHNSYNIVSKPARSYTTSVTFTDCVLVNADLSKSLEQLTVSFAGATVLSTAADLAIAYPEAPEGKVAAWDYLTYGDAKYLVIAYADADKAGLVKWGFGISEYWMIGAEASHADATVDEFFIYAFAPLTVAAGENTATATLKAITSGVVKMSLTLQSYIKMNLIFAEGLKDAKIAVNGEEYVLVADAEGKYAISTAIAPNVANQAVEAVITIGENDFTLSVGIGSYARTLLADEAYASAHQLTYAMVEYVRAMTKDQSFLADVQAPAGYEAQAPGEDAYEKGENTLLNSISFQIDGTIALAIKGEAAAKGMEVKLALATGRTERATVGEDLTVIFEGLYVNEFYGDMTITVGAETYTYSIENYYNAMNEAYKSAIAALYNYAQYAQEYVDTLPKN